MGMARSSISDNDWQDDSIQAAELIAAGLAPTNNLESAIAATLPPGLYTALLSGMNNSSGVGLVEVYEPRANRREEDYRAWAGRFTAGYGLVDDDRRRAGPETRQILPTRDSGSWQRHW